MKDIISKELLSEVLNQTVEEIHNTKSVELRYIVSMGGYWYINIYELAHKCKEWAYKRIEQLVWDEHNKVIYINIYGSDVVAEGGFTYDKSIEANTEPEAIFKACQWILDNKEK